VIGLRSLMLIFESFADTILRHNVARRFCCWGKGGSVALICRLASAYGAATFDTVAFSHRHVPRA